VATGVPLPSSEGPLIIPRGPEVVATPLPVANPVVGAQQVHPLVSAKPLDIVFTCLLACHRIHSGM